MSNIVNQNSGRTGVQDKSQISKHMLFPQASHSLLHIPATPWAFWKISINRIFKLKY